MVDAVPADDTVITAVKTRIDTIASIGTVYKGRHRYKDDIEFLQKGAFLDGVSPSFDVWFVWKKAEAPFSGKGTGEDYCRFMIGIEHWSLRTAPTTESEWDEQHTAKDKQVVNDLTGNAAVFAIAGQRQLYTDETVEVLEHGPHELTDELQQTTQRVMRTLMELSAEARRYA